MASDETHGHLRALATALAADPKLAGRFRAAWRPDGADGAATHALAALPPDLRPPVADLRALLPRLVSEDAPALAGLFGEPAGEVLLAWCSATTSRRDTSLARLLELAAAHGGLRERVAEIARGRIVEGPVLDALECAPLFGDGQRLSLRENAQARARLEILVWEAGASALEVPTLGPWLWGSRGTFEAMIRAPAHGALRGRVLAARCLEVGVLAMPEMTDPELVGSTLQVLQPLLLHPEPLVWVHAARALGRLTGPIEQMQGTVVDWVFGQSRVLRQRAMTAFASFPAERLRMFAGQLTGILEARDAEPWVLAAAAAATPYLFAERSDIWERLAARVLAVEGGAIAARALAKGLATLWRRGVRGPAVEFPLLRLREIARRTRAVSLDESRRWIEVIAVTDALDGAERDPLDLEIGLENLTRVAAQYDDEEADARAARFALQVAPTFVEARRAALGTGSVRHRASAINALEGCARSLALRLWWPLLVTSPAFEPVPEPKLEETWKTIARAPAEILDVVKERRQTSGAPLDADLPLEVLAVRLGGYALDACGEDADLGPGRGPTAHDTCQWLRKLEGLADGSRALPPELESALSAVLWRLVDTTRGTALGEVDDVKWLGPFAAWWALVIDRPAMLLKLATALPMMDSAALEHCCKQADELRTALSAGVVEGGWRDRATEALRSLRADDTVLADALRALADALAAFASARGPDPHLEASCLGLVTAANRLQGALADPVKALRTVSPEAPASDGADNAARVGTLFARAIRARELSMLDVWLASLAPVSAALVETAVRAAIRKTPPPPPKPKVHEARVVEGYELVKPIGEGGVGSVWLVRKPGADRLFVLKIPKAEALAQATESEREGILTSFVDEARVLASLYHPNVANIIDRGVSGGAPFLVLEYLIGADLKQYAAAHLMSLFELRQVVLDSCAGLAALHAAGLVHRDIKPANLWLRLPLTGTEKFDPAVHRDPARAPPLSTVVIDFGMVRPIRVPPDVGGRFVAGTAGYIAPEQVLDPVVLDPRSDVYALAGTIYNTTTGRSFFDEIDNPRDRIVAHMRRDPFEETARLRAYPAGVARLLRAATMKEPGDRPSPIEFGREFAAAL
jgi:serine/threonine-protein kinase